jgi:hypothetical protein
VNDIETVRKFVGITVGPVVEALDRIEAEQSRLRDAEAECLDLHHQGDYEEWRRLEAEVERLRAELTEHDSCVACSIHAPASAEVERRRLQELVRRAARVFDDHIDTPQAVSHAELRATAKEFRAALAKEEA